MMRSGFMRRQASMQLLAVTLLVLCPPGPQQVHHVGLGQEQLACILDGDQALVVRDMVDQRLHEGGLAAAGRTGYHDVLAVHHRTPEELGVFARMAQLQQLTILLADAAIAFRIWLKKPSS